MDTEQVTQELHHPDAQTLLLSSPLTRLAYTGRDGLPRVIPIGFHWNGKAVVVCTAPISPKVAALSARPQVALTIDTDSFPNKALLIRGLSTMETVDGVPDEYIAAAAKTMDDAQLPEFERQVRSLYKQMSRISITPGWARFYDFGAGRVPAFLTKLADNP